jgi:hypothetical protein
MTLPARALPAILAVLAATLAGCAGGEGQPDATAAPAPPPVTEAARPPETFAAHGHIVAAYRSNPTAFGADFPRIFFNVTGDVTAILIELAWDDPVQDLDAYAHGDHGPCDDPALDPDRAACEADFTLDGYDLAEVRNRGGGPGAPDSPSRVLATRDDLAGLLGVCGDPCAFGSYPTTHQTEPAAADVEWRNYVTLFHGPVPDGFTAIPPP